MTRIKLRRPNGEAVMRISMDMARMGQKVADSPDPDTAFLSMMRPPHASAIVMADEEMKRVRLQ